MIRYTSRLLTLVFMISGFLIQGCGDNRPRPGATNLGADEESIGVSKEVRKDRVNFNTRLITARRVLDGKTTGKEVLREIDKTNTYSEPLTVVEVTPTELRKYNLGGLSGIRKRTFDGKYEILVNVDLDVDGLAHGLASALELFKVAIDEDRYAADFPEVGKSLAMAHQALVDGTFKEYAQQNKKEAQLVLKGMFFGEMKAMETCAKLHEEGLRFPLKKRQGAEIYDYIYSTHIEPLVDEDSQFNASETYNLIKTMQFQKIRQLYTFFLSKK